MPAQPLGTAELIIRPDVGPLPPARGALAPHGERAGRDLGGVIGRTLGRVVGPLAVAAAVAAVGNGVAASVRAAGSLEQSLGAIDTVFKGNSTQMHTWAQSASTSVGLARDEYNNLAVLIGSQLKNAGTAMDELGPKTNDLITAGADMASMFGGTTKEAVEAISSALKGERDPIERYGVTLRQATIDAKAAAMGFEKVNGAFDAQAQSAATLALIMEQTADAQGNFARESSTYEGVGQRLAASWDNIVATLGFGFLPFATAARSILLELMPTVQGLADGFASFGATMQDAFTANGGGMAGVAAMLQNALGGVVGWLASGGLTHLFDAALGLTVPAIIAILDTIPGLLASYLDIYPALAEAIWVDLIGGLILGLTESRPELQAELLGLLPQIVATLAALVPLVIAAGVELFLGLVDALVIAIPQIVSAVIGILPVLAEALLSMLPQIIEAGLGLFQGLVQAVVELVPVLITAILDLLPSIVTTVVSMLPDLVIAGIELFLGLVLAIAQALPDIIVAIVGMIPQFVSALVSMIPTLVAAGIELMRGLVLAVSQSVPAILRTITRDVIPAIVGAVVGAVGNLVSAGADLIRGLIAGLWDMAWAVGEALMSLIGDAVDGFLGFLGIHSPSRLMRGYGQNTGESLVDELAAARDRYEAIDANVAPGSMADLHRRGIDPRSTPAATYEVNFHDHSTSTEDRAARIAAAEAHLRAQVEHGLWPVAA